MCNTDRNLKRNELCDFSEFVNERPVVDAHVGIHRIHCEASVVMISGIMNFITNAPAPQEPKGGWPAAKHLPTKKRARCKSVSTAVDFVSRKIDLRNSRTTVIFLWEAVTEVTMLS